MSKSTTIFASVAGVLLIGAFAVWSLVSRGSVSAQSATTATTVAATEATKELTTTPVDTAVSSGATDTTVVTPAASAYKDGSYTATGSYRTPESMEQLTVTLTLKGDVVVDSSVTFAASQAHESRQYQSQFAAGYKQYVVGKNIKDISVSRVSGSSLTSIGFTSALEKIKTEAQA